MTWTRHREAPAHDRTWRAGDFTGKSMQAAAQTLSRLARAGEISRIGKGIYYRGRETPFGRSRPSPALLRSIAEERAAIFPAGIAAAAMLGLTTQTPRVSEVSTTASSLPRQLMGADTIIHTRRPSAWERLTPLETSILETLRSGGSLSELSEQETVTRMLELIREESRYERLARAAATEPPRVRAMLGAIGETLGKDTGKLRKSLNALSRFEFGLLRGIPTAANWYAKKAPIS